MLQVLYIDMRRCIKAYLDNEIIASGSGTWRKDLRGLAQWLFRLRSCPIFSNSSRCQLGRARTRGWRICRHPQSWAPLRCYQWLRFCPCRRYRGFSWPLAWLLPGQWVPSWPGWRAKRSGPCLEGLMGLRCNLIAAAGTSSWTAIA